jgi:hypothetical protein
MMHQQIVSGGQRQLQLKTKYLTGDWYYVGGDGRRDIYSIIEETDHTFTVKITTGKEQWHSAAGHVTGEMISIQFDSGKAILTLL